MVKNSEVLHSLKSSLEFAKDAIVVATADEAPLGPSVVFVNCAFVNLADCVVNEVVGENLENLCDLKTQSEIFRRLFKDLGSRLQRACEVNLDFENEPETSSEWQIVPLLDAEGTVRQWLGIHSDIRRLNDARGAREASVYLDHQLIESHLEPICRLLPDTTLTYVNAAYAELFHCIPQDLISKRFSDIASPEDTSAILAHLESFTPGEPVGQFEQKNTREDGNVQWHRWNTFAVFQGDGKASLFQSVGTDITLQRKAEEALRKVLSAVEQSPSSILITDTSGSIEYVNPAFVRTSGYSHREAIGQNPRILKSGLVPNEVYADLWEAITSGEPWRGKLANKRKNGETYWDLVAIAPVKNPEGKVSHFVSVQHEITEQQRLDEQLAHDATHDSLTNLVNRREFERRLDQAVKQAKEHSSHHVLCYLDLDQFKLVNDTAGHAAGDELLTEIRGILISKFRGRDTVARLGGDEFGVLLEHCKLEKALKITEMLITHLYDFRFKWNGQTFRIGASIGLVAVTRETGNAAQAMAQADVACYTAKDNGRNCIRIYQKEGTELHDEILCAVTLREAVEEDRFCLYGQPIVELSTKGNRPTCYELLVRMIDRTGELALPGSFIPAAERYGIMGAIDRWVIKKAFHSFAKLLVEASPANIAVNLSGNTLNDETFLDFLQEQFRESGFPEERVCFEITETAAIQNMGNLTELITEIRKRGSRFALDDFGSGLSSFHYLKTLPVDYVKIDGRFVQDMMENSVDHAMVSAINDVGHIMGIKIIAEYAHSEAIVQRLTELGVDYAQGHAMGVPMPLDEIAVSATF